MRAHAPIAAIALVLSACTAAPTTSASTQPTSGAERVPPTPPRSVLPEARRALMRFDMRRIRSTPLAAELAPLFSRSPVARRFIGGSGLDPIRDLELLVVASTDVHWRGPLAVGSHWTFLMRHSLDRDVARERLARVAAGAPLVFREHQGLPAAELPDTGGDVPHSIVLVDDHDAVIAPSDDVPRVLDAARDQRAHDPTGARELDPAYAREPAELVLVEGVEIAAYRGLPETRALSLRALSMADGSGARVVGTLSYASAADAAQASRTIVGLALVLGARASGISADGAVVHVDVPLSWAVVHAIVALVLTSSA